MSAKVTWGHGVLNAVNRPRGGHLIVVGANYWSADDRPGYTGFDTPVFEDDSVRTLDYMVRWLTGKSTGASVLVLCQNATPGEKTYPVTDAPTGYQFGNAFQNALLLMGHSVTSTGANSSWWNGPTYEPLDYDLVCASGGLSAGPAYHGMTTRDDKWDYILDNQGALLAEVSDLTMWARYGFAGNQNHSNDSLSSQPHYFSDGPTHWRYQRPFTCAQFGDPGTGGSWNTNDFALVMYTTIGLQVRPENVPTNTRGGTSVIVDCPLEKVRFHGDQFGGTQYDNTGILGLWWV